MYKVTPKAINKLNGVSINAAQLNATKLNNLSITYNHLFTF